MTTYTVLLNTGTVGTINADTLDGQHPIAFIGDMVIVHLRDENGNPVQALGRLVEVLERNQ